MVIRWKKEKVMRFFEGQAHVVRIAPQPPLNRNSSRPNVTTLQNRRSQL
jgi:hypothetical protein